MSLLLPAYIVRGLDQNLLARITAEKNPPQKNTGLYLISWWRLCKALSSGNVHFRVKRKQRPTSSISCTREIWRETEACPMTKLFNFFNLVDPLSGQKLSFSYSGVKGSQLHCPHKATKPQSVSRSHEYEYNISLEICCECLSGAWSERKNMHGSERQ